MTTDTASQVAYAAQHLAETAHLKIDGHEALCAERYLNIGSSIAEIKKLLGWVGTVLTTVLIGAFAWLYTQQVSANQNDIATNNRDLRELRSELGIPEESAASKRRSAQ